MTIKDIKVGDILHPENRADIIIGMNLTLEDVRGIGKPFIGRIRLTRALRLGQVITFDYDGTRQLHMLICHQIGEGGWANAGKDIRYCLDWLQRFAPERDYSIVDIGTGRVGKRDGADPGVIRQAIATSHLPVTLYVLPFELEALFDVHVLQQPRAALRIWDQVDGPADIRQVAEAA